LLLTAYFPLFCALFLHQWDLFYQCHPGVFTNVVLDLTASCPEKLVKKTGRKGEKPKPTLLVDGT